MSESVRCWMLVMVLIPLAFMLLCIALVLIGASMMRIWFPVTFSVIIYVICQITFYKVLGEFRDHATKSSEC